MFTLTLVELDEEVARTSDIVCGLTFNVAAMDSATSFADGMREEDVPYKSRGRNLTGLTYLCTNTHSLTQ